MTADKAQRVAVFACAGLIAGLLLGGAPGALAGLAACAAIGALYFQE